MNGRPQDFKIMHEWYCCSRAYAFIYLYFGSVGAYICFLYLMNILFKYPNFSIITVLLAAISTLFLWKLFKTKRNNIKQVYFTSKDIYIEDKKIDISYLESVTLIEQPYPSLNKALFTFCIKFTKNQVIKEDVYFYMAFGNRLFEWNEDYDYQNRFITILETIAKERRELLKNSGKASYISE